MLAATPGVPTSFKSDTAFASSPDCKPHEKTVWRQCHDGTQDVTGPVRRDSVLCFLTSAGAEPARGARRNSYQGRGAHLASCHPSKTGHWDCRGSCSTGRTRNAIGAAGRIEYRHRTRFAQPTPPELHVQPPDGLNGLTAVTSGGATFSVRPPDRLPLTQFGSPHPSTPAAETG